MTQAHLRFGLKWDVEEELDSRLQNFFVSFDPRVKRVIHERVDMRRFNGIQMRII